MENQHLAGQCTCSPIPTASALRLSSGSQSLTYGGSQSSHHCTNIPLLAYMNETDLCTLKMRTLNALPSLLLLLFPYVSHPQGNHCTIVAPCPPFSPCSAAQALSVVLGTPIWYSHPYCPSLIYLSLYHGFQRRIPTSIPSPLFQNNVFDFQSPYVLVLNPCLPQETVSI